MILESLILLVLVLAASYLIMRAGRRGTAFSILPLVLVPVMNLVGYQLAPWLDHLSSAMNPNHWRVLLTMAGLAVAEGIIGVISMNIKRKAARRTYLLMCGGFSLVFAFIILVDVLPAL